MRRLLSSKPVLMIVLLLGVAMIGSGAYYSLLSPQETIAEVLSVIDGDTILLKNGEYVRLIGIDSPEKGDKYYYEAKDYLSSLIGGTVRLERDVENRDKYGRLLRYVYQGDLFVNANMISAGYATSYPYPPNIKYVETFDRLEQIARHIQVGMFSVAKSESSYVPRYEPVSPFPDSSSTSKQSFGDILNPSIEPSIEDAKRAYELALEIWQREKIAYNAGRSSYNAVYIAYLEMERTKAEYDRLRLYHFGN
ncbi:MAG: thermonuclease family protein [Chloroflexota bacterium]